MARPPTPFEVARSIAEGRLLLAAYEAGLPPPDLPEAFTDDLEAVFDVIVNSSPVGLTHPLNDCLLFLEASDEVYRVLVRLVEEFDGQ